MGEERDPQEHGVSHDAERRRVGAVYGRYAEDPRKQRAWSAANAGNQAIRAELVQHVLPLVPAAGRLLDVGCGSGWWLACLCEHGVAAERLAGLELQADRAALTAQRVPGADVRTGDAGALPYADGEVAVVTLFTVLSSMGAEAQRRRALREARRVVGPGGRVVVWEPRVPTGNRQTARVPLRLLREELGRDADVRSLTLLPPLARRLPGRWYPRLARAAPLRTHRLFVVTA